MIDIHEEVLAYLKEEAEKDGDTKESQSIEVYSGTSIEDIIIYAKKNSFNVVDNREKNGALWVYYDEDNTIHSSQLKKMNMRYKMGRGWWIK